MKSCFNTIPFNPARWPFFYGWNILLWGIIGILLSAPGQTTGVSAFTEPLLGALQMSRLDLSAAYMLGTICSSFILTPAGKLYDRVGSRWMGTASCLLLGLVLLALSQADKITNALSLMIPHRGAAMVTMSVLFFLVRFSGQGLLTLSSRNMMMKWFDRHRGIVSGISGVTVGYGFSTVPKICHSLIEQHDWNGTWFGIALIWLLIFVPLLLIFFRDNPEDCGLIPDGKTADAKERKLPEIHHPFTLAEARATFTFWVFGLALALEALYLTAITFHIESIFSEAGMEGARGFSILPYSALVGIASTLVGGWLSDRLPLRFFYSFFLMMMSGSMLGFIFLSPRWIPLIIVCFGLANGLFGLLMSVTWPKYFGRKHLGAISGLNMSMLVFGSAIGPMLFSLSLKWLHSYRASLTVCLGITLLLLAASFRAHNPQQKYQ